VSVVFRIRTLWLSVPLSLVACGTGSSPAIATDAGDAQTQLADVVQGGPADSSSGSNPADGGAPADATVATTSAPFFRGGVSLSFAAINLGTQSDFTAYFEQVTDPACVERQMGACSVFRCDLPADGGPLAIALESAGLLLLSSADGGALAEIGPDAGGVYYQGSVTNGSISTGDALTLTALGSDVPPFTAHMLFPPQVQLGDASTTISLSQGYAITWSGADAVLLRVELQEQTVDRNVRVVCDFPGDAGSAVVPPAALYDLEVATFSATGNHADLEVFAASITQVDAGGYPVTIVARQGGISALPRFQ
jgi:hypothetical protein